MSDDELLRAFEGAMLRPEAFGHEAHVRVAFLYLRRDDPIEALARYRRGLKRLARSLGAPGKYHETVTCALFFLIHERMACAADCRDWPEFASANPDLLEWGDGVFFEYYDPGVLESGLARRTFLLPKPIRSETSAR